MDIVKLVDFVKTGELFEKIEWDYEQIVSDFDFAKIEWCEWFVKINKIWDLIKIDKSKLTLFILDELLPENISDYFDMAQFTILDLNFGLGAYWNNIWLSKLDLWDLIDKNISVYEPLDLISLFSDLEIDNKINKKYIRISDFDLPWNFVNGDVKDIVSMADSGLSGWAFTIVTTGTMLPEIVRVANILNENWLFVDVFVLNKLNFDLDEKMNALLTHNANIMFVLDLMNSDSYENWVNSKIKDVNIKFIYPNYNKLTTVFGEYKNEETFFDAEGLVNRLK